MTLADNEVARAAAQLRLTAVYVRGRLPRSTCNRPSSSTPASHLCTTASLPIDESAWRTNHPLPVDRDIETSPRSFNDTGYNSLASPHSTSNIEPSTDTGQTPVHAIVGWQRLDSCSCNDASTHCVGQDYSEKRDEETSGSILVTHDRSARSLDDENRLAISQLDFW